MVCARVFVCFNQSSSVCIFTCLFVCLLSCSLPFGFFTANLVALLVLTHTNCLLFRYLAVSSHLHSISVLRSDTGDFIDRSVVSQKALTVFSVTDPNDNTSKTRRRLVDGRLRGHGIVVATAVVLYSFSAVVHSKRGRSSKVVAQTRNSVFGSQMGGGNL